MPRRLLTRPGVGLCGSWPGETRHTRSPGSCQAPPISSCLQRRLRCAGTSPPPPPSSPRVPAPGHGGAPPAHTPVRPIQPSRPSTCQACTAAALAPQKDALSDRHAGITGVVRQPSTYYVCTYLLGSRGVLTLLRVSTWEPYPCRPGCPVPPVVGSTLIMRPGPDGSGQHGCVLRPIAWFSGTAR